MVLGHTEFKLSICGDAMEEPEFCPCPELNSLCDLISAPRLTRSPYELYPTPNQILTISIDDLGFLLLDTTGPADGMCMVGLQYRCQTDLADTAETLVRQIRDRSEIKTALLRGDLGLSLPGDAAQNPDGG